MTIPQFLLINLGALVTAAGGIFLKRLSESFGEPTASLTWIGEVLGNPYLWAGGACYVFPIALWAYLLRTMELTKLQPLLAVVHFYTIVLAYVFLGEQASLQRLAGIALIVAGVIMVSRT